MLFGFVMQREGNSFTTFGSFWFCAKKPATFRYQQWGIKIIQFIAFLSVSAETMASGEVIE